MSRILIVDDMEDIRDLARLRLEAAGHAIVGEATTGREAIALAAATDPDLILLDVLMPEMTGLEALAELRAIAPRARVLVYCSVPSLTVEDVRRLGAHDLLPKSESARLADVVAALVG